MKLSRSKFRRKRFSFCYASFEQLEPRNLLAAIAGYHPNQINRAYEFDVFGPNRGAGQTIAITVPYHDPTIRHDLKVFDRAFGLPDPPKFTIITLDTSAAPAQDPFSAEETAIDIEWAHAIAPAAKLVLVEAKNNNLLELFHAELVAAQTPGVSVVSMSWGRDDFASEEFFEPLFTTFPNITFVAATGDTGSPASYPGLSPHVVGVGGTTLKLDRFGNYKSESAWIDGGGGTSLYIDKPAYQIAANTPGDKRSAPDIAFNSDTNTSYAIYTSAPGTSGWELGNGTSNGTPVAAGMFAIVNQYRKLIGYPTLHSANADLYKIYRSPLYAAAFHDIMTGHIVNHGSGPAFYEAGPGYDFATGLGSPRASVLIPLLMVMRESPVATVSLASAATPLAFASADFSLTPLHADPFATMATKTPAAIAVAPLAIRYSPFSSPAMQLSPPASGDFFPSRRASVAKAVATQSIPSAEFNSDELLADCQSIPVSVL